MNSAAELWAVILDYIKLTFVDEQKKISPVAFQTWIRPLTLSELTAEDVAVLSAKNTFQVTTCSRYAPLLREAIEAVVGFPVTLRFVAEEAEEEKMLTLDEVDAENSYSLREELYAPESTTVRLTTNADASYTEGYTFDNFIVGSSNKFAHAAALAVAQNPAGPFNPLFIYGPSGLGKTHLLNAIKNEIRSKRPSYNIQMMKGVDFTNGIVDSIKNGTINDYHRAFQRVDVLLLDDIQFIAGKERTQEEFFHTFNRMYEAKKQIVLASDRPPKEIKALDERLRTRFEMGLLADIGYPDFETRVAIVRRKADSLNLDLSMEVCNFIANRLKSDIRQLEGVVKKMKIYSSLDGQASINLSLAQLAITDTLKEEKSDVDILDRIFEEVCRTYNVTPDDVRSKKRTMNISLARRVTMYVIRTVMEMSLPDIGKQFSRDHSTVIYNISEVEKERSVNPYFKSTVDDIIKNVKG